MKLAHRTLPALALALAAVVSMPAIARDHGHGHRDRDDRGRHHQRHDRDDRRYGRQDRYDRDDRRYGHQDRYDDRRGYRDRDVYIAPRYAPPRVSYRHGPPPHAGYPRWARGVRYDSYGYAPTYVVRDYRDYGLREPPRGHYWRRDDRGEFLLVAVATGLIASVIFN